MYSSQIPPAITLGGEPLGMLVASLRAIVAFAASCAAGLVAGSMFARQLRARGQHWSWAALVLAFAVLARGPLGALAAPLAVAGFCASRRGRRWHREDLDAGRDLQALAQARHTPLDALIHGLRGPLARAASAPARRRDGHPPELALGEDERGRVVSAPVAGGAHALVVGATGSGKTVTQTRIAAHAIETGCAAIVIDPKGDPAMRSALCGSADRSGRRFIGWSPRGGAIYNPYSSGGETEIADKLLAGERFTEPHYLRQAQRYVGHVVRALRAAGVEVSLQAVVQGLDPASLELLARRLPEARGRETHDYLDALTARQRSDLAGVRDRLAILAESDVGPWLDPTTVGAPRFELLQAIRAGAVVHFELESDRRPLLAQMLGAAIVQDLITAVASLQGRPRPALVVIDEFSAVAAPEVVRLFGRARSAGLSLLLGTQELADLRPPGRERLLEQVVGNLSLLVAHRQVVPASAELIAALAGRQGAWRLSRHSDGRSTRTRTLQARIEHDRLLSLPRGSAAVIELAGARRARFARMYPGSTIAAGGAR